MVENLLANAGDLGLILGQEDSLKKEMTAYYSILAWEIPGTEEPQGPQSMESPVVRHNLVTKLPPHHSIPIMGILLDCLSQTLAKTKVWSREFLITVRRNLEACWGEREGYWEIF